MNKKRVQELASMVPPHIKKAVAVLGVKENMAVFSAIGQEVDTLDYLAREFGTCPIFQVNALASAGLIEGGNIRPFVTKLQWSEFGLDFMTKMYDAFFGPPRRSSDD